MYPSGHKHDIVWSEHRQTAFIPHTFCCAQGSTHFRLIQASLGKQSVFIRHSGLHSLVGSPKKSGGQEHKALSPTSWQIALVPHGARLHGLLDLSSSGGKQHSKGLPISPSSQVQMG